MPPREIKVFIASPGDLAIERRAFRDTIDLLNLGFADGANVHFIPLGWEDTLASTGRRAQSVINTDVDTCDVFILALNRRWGQDAPDARPYSSYTEEEFHRALSRFKKTQSPEIFVFFKNIDPLSMVNADFQLTNVLAFRRQLEDYRTVLYHMFEDESTFKKDVDRHLRAYVKGELPKPDAARDVIILPLEYVQRVEQAEMRERKAAEEAQAAKKYSESQSARASALALSLARQAAKAALEGRIEEARQAFAEAATGTTNLEILELAFEFHKRTGDFIAAEQILQSWLAISDSNSNTCETARALGHLGVIFRRRGDLENSQEMHCKALAINEEIGHLDGMAKQCGCLGIIHRYRGDLSKAEVMHRRALAIYEKLNCHKGMAIQYGNLGLIYRTRGDLHNAEKMYCEALLISEKFRFLEGMATDYRHLGVIYQVRGDWDKAEEIHRKALAIEEKLGRLEGMAKVYGNLGLIYEERGDFGKAEDMHRKSLAIEEKLGLLEGMASDYCDLGMIQKDRGNLDKVQNFWAQSRDLYARIGMPHMVQKLQSWLAALPSDPPTTPS